MHFLRLVVFFYIVSLAVRWLRQLLALEGPREGGPRGSGPRRTAKGYGADASGFDPRTASGAGSGPSGGTGAGPSDRGPGFRTRPAGPTPHEVLGVPPGASAAVVQAAYRRLVQQYHPDQVAHMGPELREVAERKTKEINAAYSALKRG